ncbi:MAG TPA: pyruvate formate lyase family protein [Armatimonadota bacterium]|jgi:formate C-acetyltransferase
MGIKSEIENQISASPHRLPPETRALAERALDGEWGRALVDLPLTLDGLDLTGLSAERRYALGVQLIAEAAPLRITPGERIVGAATLKRAPFHELPVAQHGKAAFGSTSHLTLGFYHALDVGYRGLREEIHTRLERGDLDERGGDLLQAMRVCLDAAATWHRRHLELLDELIAGATGDERDRYREIRENLRDVPENPPTTFRQAVQALWFLFAFQRLCGNFPGIGRIDEMLGPFLQRDLRAGRITLDDARDLLAHFWIRGCEWAGAENCFGGSGDAQFYQNIVLSGMDVDGNDLTNEVTYLILDVVEELRISDFPIAVRINPRTPERLLRRIAEVQRLGGGIVAVYNEELIIAALVRFGYPEREARRFANDGCWEVQIPGETCFAYRPFDALAVLQQTLGVTGEGDIPDYPDFASLYAAFRARMAAEIEKLHEAGDCFAADGPPSTLVSLLERDCIEKGRGYFDRGARYTVFSPHAGGLPDTGNSLLAIKKIVFEERRLTLPEFVACLRADWAGREELRRELLRNLDRYGNDLPAADAMTKRVFDDFLALVGQVPSRNGVLRPPGVSTFGREIGWLPQRKATADGHHAGEILASNFSPSPGTDREGPTAVITSHCGMDLVRLSNGTALELKILPDSVKGEEGIAALIALMRAFVDLGGFFMHIDVVSSESLRDAQRHPERYPNLAVRISGWSARFVTLDEQWQEMVINRSQQVMK